MHLYFFLKERKIRCFLVIFCFLLSLSHPVYRWPKINCIRKEPQVLHLCSMQPSNSRWPHKKTQCATRHLCLFLFSTRHKNRPLQRRRSAALTRVVMKILERLIPSHLPSADGEQRPRPHEHDNPGCYISSVLADFDAAIRCYLWLLGDVSLHRCPVSYVFSQYADDCSSIIPCRAVSLRVTLLISCLADFL